MVGKKTMVFRGKITEILILEKKLKGIQRQEEKGLITTFMIRTVIIKVKQIVKEIIILKNNNFMNVNISIFR